MGLSHLNEYKFRHNFRGFLNPYCACNLKPEATSYYLLRCKLFEKQQRTLSNNIKEIDEHIITDYKNDLDIMLLYGNERYRYGTGRMIVLLTINLCKTKKEKCMVAVTRPSLLKSTDPKLFSVRVCKKLLNIFFKTCMFLRYDNFFLLLPTKKPEI